MSQPLDEDGFHSIAWDDAPPRQSFQEVHTPLDDDIEGFETISPTSATSPTPEQGNPRQSQVGSTSHVRDASLAGEIDSKEWGGRWMSIQVKDPVKEHEGSKDQYVSYAVRTLVRPYLSSDVAHSLDQLA